MTCIVAVSSNGTCYLGGDRCTGNHWDWALCQEPKVFTKTLPDGLVIGIGSSGGWSIDNVLRHHLSFDRYPTSMPVDEWVSTVFIPKYRKLLEGMKYCKTDDDAVYQDGQVVVCIKSRIFEIQGDMTMLESPPQGTAAGSGTYAARGSLFTTSSWEDQRERVDIALRSAEAVVWSVRGPFDIIEVT